MMTVLAPVIEAGYLPPVMEGFARFIRAAPVIDRMRRAVAEAEAEESEDLNGTHPCLKERLAALRVYPGSTVNDARPAIDLISKLPEWERSALTGV
jgi:hypothetical protein